MSPNMVVLLTVSGGGPTASMRGWWVWIMDLSSMQPNKFSVTSGTSSLQTCMQALWYGNLCTRPLSQVVFRRGSQGLTNLTAKWNPTRFAEERMHQRGFDGSRWHSCGSEGPPKDARIGWNHEEEAPHSRHSWWPHPLHHSLCWPNPPLSLSVMTPTTWTDPLLLTSHQLIDVANTEHNQPCTRCHPLSLGDTVLFVPIPAGELWIDWPMLTSWITFNSLYCWVFPSPYIQSPWKGGDSVWAGGCYLPPAAHS